MTSTPQKQTPIHSRAHSSNSRRFYDEQWSESVSKSILYGKMTQSSIYQNFPQKILKNNNHENSIQQDNFYTDLCPIHNIPFVFYCLSDFQKICEKCIVYNDHKNHNYKKIEELFFEFREIESGHQDIIQQLAQIKLSKNELRNEFELKSQNRSKALISKVDALNKEVLSVINERVKTIKSRIKSIFEQISGDLEFELFDIEEITKKITYKIGKFDKKTLTI